MSRIIPFILCLASATALCQPADTMSTQGPVLTWDEDAFDFGDLEQGDKVEHTFKFTNSGTQPLIITNVSTQCGCTTPKGWPRDPVMPGNNGAITIAFNSAGKIGRQNKVATVVSNAGKVNQLVLSGNVTPKKSP